MKRAALLSVIEMRYPVPPGYLAALESATLGLLTDAQLEELGEACCKLRVACGPWAPTPLAILRLGVGGP